MTKLPEFSRCKLKIWYPKVEKGTFEGTHFSF